MEEHSDKDNAETTRRKVAKALPAVIFTVYARSVMNAQTQIGSPLGSMVPSGNPAQSEQIFP